MKPAVSTKINVMSTRIAQVPSRAMSEAWEFCQQGITNDQVKQYRPE